MTETTNGAERERERVPGEEAAMLDEARIQMGL